MTRLLALLLSCLALGLVIAACGDDDEDSADTGAATTQQTEPATTEEAPAGGGGELTLTADEGGALKFDKDSLEAPAGNVTITMENPAQVPHNVAIEGDGVDEEGEVVEQGGTSTVSAELEAGEYTFYCSVPGHRQGGMEGSLTVTG